MGVTMAVAIPLKTGAFTKIPPYIFSDTYSVSYPGKNANRKKRFSREKNLPFRRFDT
jgi:hypothetical protein